MFHISNEYVKGDFCHDLVKDNLNYSFKCLTCEKVFTFIEADDQNTNIFREACPVKVNER